MQTTNFGHYLVEQGFLETLALGTGIAACYLALMTTVTMVAGPRVGVDSARAFILASALVLALFVSFFTLFEAAALYLRYEPHGTGSERGGADREQFVLLARVGFALLYVAILLAAAGVGYAVARRLRAGRPRRVAAAVGSAIVAFLALTFPLAEFENACNIGEPIVLQSSC